MTGQIISTISILVFYLYKSGEMAPVTDRMAPVTDRMAPVTDRMAPW